LANFIEKVSHEFRTPLSTIGTSVYLMTRTTDPERMQQRADQIERQIQRMARLVDMQLLLVKLDSSIVIPMQPVSLHRLCEALHNGYSGETPLHYQPQPDLPLVVGNMDMLETALVQLIENARQHTPPEGKITLSNGADEDNVWVQVSDTGSGIPKEHQTRIFEAFWRQDIAHTQPGFGLGLPIVQRVVEAHDGMIEMQSEVGAGSHFRLVLPRSAESISGS
jgi:signal transduction histidine kinase